jgi:hypothetical protein
MSDNKQHDEPLLISEREAARLLDVCERTLFTMRQRGDIPCLRIGRRNLYSVQSLRDWIRAQEKMGTAGASRAVPSQEGTAPSLPHDSANGSS